MPEEYFIAKRRLRIPNGPGQTPSSVLVPAGEVFSLDGTEPVNIELLLQASAAVRRPPPEGAGVGAVVAPDKPRKLRSRRNHAQGGS